MNNQTSVPVSAFDGRVPAELACDYILPDTYPDIRRILRVTATPVLIARYAAASRLEWNGAVDYIVTFSADGAAGESLHTVHFAGDWSSAVSLPDGTEGCGILLTPSMAGCAARTVNPRKVALRATVLTDLRILRPVPAAPQIHGSAEDAARLERLTDTVPVLRECKLIAEPQQVSENLEADASQPAIAEIVSCTARVHFHEARVSRDDTLSVRLTGTAHVDCLYLAADGSYRSFSRKLPLAFMLPAAECADALTGCAPETLAASADAVVTELSAAVGENSCGERRVAEVDFTFEPQLCLFGGAQAELVLDAYSTARAVEVTPREFDYCRAARVLTANFSVSEAADTAAMHLPADCVPLDASGTVTFRALTAERGRAVLTGEAALSVILMAPDGSFLPAEAVLPLRCELAAEVHAPFAMEARGIPFDLRVRVEPGRLHFDFEVALTLTVRERVRTSAAAAVEFGDPLPACESPAGMILCYPSPGETMWSIAKRYGVAASALTAANRDAGRVVVIPRGGIAGVV